MCDLTKPTDGLEVYPEFPGRNVVFNEYNYLVQNGNPGNFRERLSFVLFVNSYSLEFMKINSLLIKFPGLKCTVKRSHLRHHYGARKWTFDENHFLVSS